MRTSWLAVVLPLVWAPGAGARAAPPGAHLAGARIAALADGALVIDADTGALVRTDAAGARVDALAIGRDAGLLAVDLDGGRAYVADRRADRVAIVALPALALVGELRTPAEPYGVALTPDRRTLVVSTIADRALVAYDVATGAERWRAALGAEPRGVAISPDGALAVVGSVATGAVDRVELGGAHRVEQVALSTARRAPRACRRCGPAFARAAFAVAFVDDRRAVVPFQREVPIGDPSPTPAARGLYGGSPEPPIEPALALLDVGDRRGQEVVALAPRLARALAWDPARDAVYVAGMGDDTIVQLRGAARPTPIEGWTAALEPTLPCGADGLAVAGDHLLVWCAFTRRVLRIGPVDAGGRARPTVAAGPTLLRSAMSPSEHAGFAMFHTAAWQISRGGALACASCHPDGRADGLTWQIDDHPLQTPVLAGRLVGTRPFKWDGGDPLLRDSLAATIQRLGGGGLTGEALYQLVDYLEALPAVRPPTRDPAQVARGQAVFERAGCRVCHDGPAYTDAARHRFGGTLPAADTPSLLGLAASAPYYHDGSAPTLGALLRGAGRVRGMLDHPLPPGRELADLTAFLESL